MMNEKLIAVISTSIGVLMCLVFLSAGVFLATDDDKPRQGQMKSQALECALAEQEDNAFMKGYKLARNECD